MRSVVKIVVTTLLKPQLEVTGSDCDWTAGLGSRESLLQPLAVSYPHPLSGITLPFRGLLNFGLCHFMADFIVSETYDLLR